MKNPCEICKREGLENIKPLTLSQIANKYVKVKVNGIEITLCPYHFDENVNILEIDEIIGTRIRFIKK